jgi:hypothetical protein
VSRMHADLRQGRWQDALADVESVDALIVERFWEKTTPEPNTGCWLWTCATDRRGYGKFQIWVTALKKQAHVRAPRFALALKLGRWPDGFALHLCDTPECCNPDHLREGSQRDNIADMDARGRRGSKPLSSYARGDQHHARKRPECMARGERHGSRTRPSSVLRGEDNPVARLSESEARQIKANRGFVSASSLASTFGVTRHAVYLIHKGRNWKHV